MQCLFSAPDLKLVLISFPMCLKDCFQGNYTLLGTPSMWRNERSPTFQFLLKLSTVPTDSPNGCETVDAG